MALAQWPATLPDKPFRAGFERRPKPAVIAFGTEVGPGKRRRRSSIRMKLENLVFDIDVDQIATFETWFETAIGDGSFPFTWVDPIGSVASRWQFDATDPYRLTCKGGRRWALACKLERLS